MKKFALILAIIIMLTAAGCGGTVLETIDKNKTQIYISVYDGGTGTAWIESEAKSFNANNSKYQVMITPEKLSAGQIINDAKSGNPSASAYFTVGVDFQTGIYNNYFEDLSDILEMKVDGNDGTIGSKIKNYDEWKKVSSISGNGCYMLPYADSLAGFVYDQQLFVEKGWLTYANPNDTAVTSALTSQGISYTISGSEIIFNSSTGKTNYTNGDIILTDGKDGKYGTYDDGQPETIAQWSDMINIIVAASAKPFIWTCDYSEYTNQILYGIFVQYEGLDNFETYFSLDSNGKEITLHDGTTAAITVDNGYNVFKMEGLYKALKFMDDYLNNENYLHPASVSDGTSHTDAQNQFLLGFKEDKTNPLSALLVEGVWWENEAKAMFNQLKSDGYSDRAFGVRDYRYMLYPAIEGQVGIDGNGNGSVLTGMDTGSILVTKESNAEKLSAVKEFIAYTLRDECLKNFTIDTGIIRPYYYNLTDSELSKMTKFAQNVWQLYNDTENIAIVRPQISRYKEPISFASDLNFIVSAKISSINYSTMILVLQRYDLSTVYNGIINNYNTSSWAELITKARAEGFYS